MCYLGFFFFCFGGEKTIIKQDLGDSREKAYGFGIDGSIIFIGISFRVFLLIFLFLKNLSSFFVYLSSI